jgi:hypothetical protein
VNSEARAEGRLKERNASPMILRGSGSQIMEKGEKTCLKRFYPKRWVRKM